jgi:hypothetical protein
MRIRHAVPQDSRNQRRRGAAFVACLVIPTTIAAAHAVRGDGDEVGRAVTISEAVSPSDPASQRRPDYRTEINLALGLRDHEIVTLPVFDEPGVPVRTPISIDGEPFTLDLVPTSVRADDYRVLVQIDDGSYVEEAPGPIRTVTGRLLERPGSSVAGSVLEDGFHMVIDAGGGAPRVWIEPASRASDQGLPDDHIMYTADDIIASPGICGVTGDGEPEIEDDGGAAEGGVAGGCATPYWITEVAIEADHEMYISLGGSVASVEAWVSNIIATMNAQYQSEVGIRHVITTIIVRASAADPYSDTTSPGSLLNQLENHWNSQQGGVQRDVVHMFTGRSLDNPVIGIANLSAICVLGNAYGIVENINATLACMTDLSAHELGHNWSADHCSCSGNTMNSSLTCSNNFSDTQTVPQIIAFRNSRNCLVSQCVPENDDCVGAITVGSGVYPFTTDLTFTDGPADSLCNFDGDNQVGSDIWFRYDAECAGDVTVDVCMAATYDAKIAVYAGGCPSLVNSALACDDDGCGGSRPQVTFLGQNDTTYHIRVGGFQGAQGEGTLTVDGPECVPAPINDACGTATTVGLGTGPLTTLGATTDGFSESGCGGTSQIINDTWFRYFALEDGDLTVTADGDFDTKVAIYGASCPSGSNQSLACNDDAGGNSSSVTIPVTTFQLYRIRVGSPDGSVGTGTLTLSTGPIDDPCPGDTNGDDVIDIDDVVNVVLDFGCTQPPDCPNGGDVNGDDVVNIDDIVFVVLNFGAPCP